MYQRDIKKMKSVFRSFSIFTILILIFSCGENKEQENQALREEVIEIHDEVMPHMGDLKSLRKSIINKAELLENEDEVGNEQEIIELRILANEMDDAFESMFVWMRQFKQSYEDMTPEEVHAYLLDQKGMVEKVNQDITQSMARAKAALGD